MTGIAPRVCLGVPGVPCGRRVVGRSRCSDCDAMYERAREARRSGTRLDTNPWRWVYRDARWKKARKARLRIDGYACVDCGLHDSTGSALQVDHDPPLQDRGDECDPFDVETLRTRCSGPGTRNCHSKAEAARRRARRARRTP